MGVDAKMFVRTKAAISADEIKRLAFRLGETFGHERFYLNENGWDGKPRHAITRLDVYEQDGPTITPENEETFLGVSLGVRYYGPGYERGDLVFIIALADWLERNVPGGEVWYGGDSSGICAARFGPLEREAMFSHFALVGHTPYTEYFSRDHKYGHPSCEFCDALMTRSGFGRDYAAYVCCGCGARIETRDGGVTWKNTHAVGGNKIEGES